MKLSERIRTGREMLNFEQVADEVAQLEARAERLRVRFRLIKETVEAPSGKMTVLELFTQLSRACDDALLEPNEIAEIEKKGYTYIFPRWIKEYLGEN